MTVAETLSFPFKAVKTPANVIAKRVQVAALRDGYSHLRSFWKISLLQALTGIAAAAVFCFLTAWNEFVFSQILSTGSPLTAPPSIVGRTGSGGTEWGQVAAGRCCS